MLKAILCGYAVIAVVLFFLLVLFGKVKRKNLLGVRMKCGIINSFLLASLWPMTALAVVCGIWYETIRIWKKI